MTDPALCAAPDQLGNPRPTPCAAGAVEFITAATTRYVAATGGGDTGDCANPAAPCATLAYALGQAATGDTIRVLPGTHTVVIRQHPGLVVACLTAENQAIARATPISCSTFCVVKCHRLSQKA